MFSSGIIKKLVFLSVILFFQSGLGAQFDTSFVKKNIKICADSLATGFKGRNWDLFSRYTNPSIIGTMGGRSEFINYIARAFGPIPASAWKVYEPGKVLQVINTGNDFQSVIELQSVIEWDGKRITTILYLVGQSWDGGLFWTFFDSQNDVKAARQIKPDLSNELIIPAKNEKVESVQPPTPLKPANEPVNNKPTGKTGND